MNKKITYKDLNAWMKLVVVWGILTFSIQFLGFIGGFIRGFMYGLGV